jgi:hypothetical protein
VEVDTSRLDIPGKERKTLIDYIIKIWASSKSIRIDKSRWWLAVKRKQELELSSILFNSCLRLNSSGLINLIAMQALKELINSPNSLKNDPRVVSGVCTNNANS